MSRVHTEGSGRPSAVAAPEGESDSAAAFQSGGRRLPLLPGDPPEGESDGAAAFPSGDRVPGGGAARPPRRLQKRILFVLGVINLVECINYNNLLPYVEEMSSRLLHRACCGDPTVGRLAGALVGLSALCEFLFSPFWGALADRVGRKPVLLLGLAGSVMAALVFGTAESLAQALLGRALDGLFCGNVGVTRAYLGELVGGGENEARGFSILAMCFSMGLFIGPLLGGYLSFPADRFPAAFKGTLFERFPFLLPNLAYACLTVLAWAVGLVFLVETLPSSAPSSAEREERSGQQRLVPLSTAAATPAGGVSGRHPGHWWRRVGLTILLCWRKRRRSDFGAAGHGAASRVRDGDDEEEELHEVNHGPSSAQGPAAAVSIVGGLKVGAAAAGNHTGIEEGQIDQERGASSDAATSMISPIAHSLFFSPFAASVGTYCCLTAYYAAWSQNFVLIASLPRSVDGFALDSGTIGTLQNFVALGQGLSQALVYPWCCRRCGYFRVFLVGWLGGLAVTLPFPAYGLVADPHRFGKLQRLLPLALFWLLGQMFSGFCFRPPSSG